MAITSRIPLRNVFGEEELPDIDYNGIRPYRGGNGPKHRFFIRDNMVVEIKQIVVHHFRMGDVEDPDLYAAEPLYQWQESPQGKWVMENAHETPMWNRVADPDTFGHKYYITASFEGKKLTEYYLRYGQSKKP